MRVLGSEGLYYIPIYTFLSFHANHLFDYLRGGCIKPYTPPIALMPRIVKKMGIGGILEKLSLGNILGSPVMNTPLLKN